MVLLTFNFSLFQDLVDELKDELRGNFEQAVEALMDAPPVHDAKTLRKAMAVCIL